MRLAPLPRRVIERSGRFYYRRRRRGRETYVRLPDLFDPAFGDALAEAERATAEKPVHALHAAPLKAWHDKSRRYAPGVKLPPELIIAAREAKKRAGDGFSKGGTRPIGSEK